MVSTHSQFGCPGDFFKCDTDKKIRLVIDPPKGYFQSQIISDRNNFDKLVLIQGMEPRQLNDISLEVISNKNYFDKILSSFPEVLSSCDNSELFLYASCWILTRENKTRANHRVEYHNIFDTNKKFKLSFVMSQKNFLPGHSLRHQLKSTILKNRGYELMFPGSIPMEEKYKLFEDSMFHIAIENTQNVNYVSEKIVDCFMSYTIPIYWGCPNIGDYFNMDGILTFQTPEEFENILDNLNEQFYKDRLDAVMENYQIANEKYSFYSDRVNEVLNRIANQ